MYDIIVVGGGPAGLSAAIHSANFGLRTLVLEAGERVGGIANRARGIGNYPGFVRRISGLKLMEKTASQAEKVGVEIRTSEEVIELSLNGANKIVETSKGRYGCEALILAMGDMMKGLGMKWETWIGAGVGYCAQCAEPYLKGKEIVIIGNVDSAVDEALHLIKIAKSVTLVNHANMINIDAEEREKLQAENISIVEDFVGKEIRGRPPSKEIVLQHISNSMTKTLRANMVLVIGGVKPIVSVLRMASIKTHRQGCIIVDELGETNIKGVFAAGGCTSAVNNIPICIGGGATVATRACLYIAYKY